MQLSSLNPDADALAPWQNFLKQIENIEPYLGSLSRWIMGSGLGQDVDREAF